MMTNMKSPAHANHKLKVSMVAYFYLAISWQKYATISKFNFKQHGFYHIKLRKFLLLKNEDFSWKAKKISPAKQSNVFLLRKGS